MRRRPWNNEAPYNPGGPTKPPPMLETFQGDRFEPVPGSKTLWERSVGNPDSDWPFATSSFPVPNSKEVWDPKCDNCGERVRYEVDYYGGYPPPTRCTRHWVHVHDGKEPCTFFYGPDGAYFTMPPKESPMDAEPANPTPGYIVTPNTCKHCEEEIRFTPAGGGTGFFIHQGSGAVACGWLHTNAVPGSLAEPLEKPMTITQCAHCGFNIERRARDAVWIHSATKYQTCGSTRNGGPNATPADLWPPHFQPEENPMTEPVPPTRPIGATGPAAPLLPDALILELTRLILTYGASVVVEATEIIRAAAR